MHIRLLAVHLLCHLAHVCGQVFMGQQQDNMIFFSAELWNILTFGMARGTTPASPLPSDSVPVMKPSEVSESPLANQSLLLVLVLSNHCTSEKNLHNPYRQALFSCSNSQGT